MFIGNFSAFTFTAAAATACNAVVKKGSLVGITKENTASGDQGLAYFGCPVSVFSFALNATADAAKTAGTKVYLNSTGKVVFTAGDGNTLIGVLWEAVAINDTECEVALQFGGLDITAAASVTATQAALTDSTGGTATATIAAPAADAYTAAELEGIFASFAKELNAARTDVAAVISALTAAGLMG